MIVKEIFELKNAGATIIFSTHRMEQVEELCQRIVLINKGKNILEGNVTELRKQFKDNQYRIEFEGELAPSFASEFETQDINQNTIQVRLQHHQTSNDLLKKLIDQGLSIVNFQEVLPSLHDIFVKRVKEFNLSKEVTI